MAVNAPTLSNAVDKASGATVTLTLTPPAAGDYDHCQILYRIRDATVWTTGGVHTGSQGTEADVDQAGLTDSQVYEFLAYAEDAGGVVGPPSVTHRAAPSDGTGPMSGRIVTDLKHAIEGITQASGYWDDVAAVYRFGYAQELEGKTMPVAFLKCAEIGAVEGPLVGAQGSTDNSMRVVVVLASERASTDDDEWVAEEAHRQLDAIVKAVLADPTRGGLARDTVPYDGTPNVETEEKLGDAVAAKQFTIHYLTQRDNPSVRLP